MNNVWTSIAFQTPCASRRAQAKPLLQLFNGYVKYHRSSYSHQPSSTASLLLKPNEQQHTRSQLPYCSTSHHKVKPGARHAFSSSTFLSARGKRTWDLLQARAHSKPPPAPRTGPVKAVASPKHDPLPATPAAEEADPLTWRDYDPEGGMPLPEGERTPSGINAIFAGEDVDADTGNYILDVMYWRRMSGALIDDGLDFPKKRGVSKEQALRALEYVRTLDPAFDEQGAGQRWAEEEAMRLSEEIQQRSLDLGIYKRREEAETEAEEPESQQGTQYGRERSGESVLQRQREAKDARWEKEQAEKVAAQEREELAVLHSQRGPLDLAGGVQPPVVLTTTGSSMTTKPWLLPIDQIRKPWVKYYEQKAQLIKTNIVPQISTLGRLGPSVLVMLLVVGLGFFASNNYTPPPKSARLFPDTPPAVATLGGLTAALLTFFCLARFPPFWRTLSKYFTIVAASPHAISLLGAPFRHNTLSHLALNLVPLWLFGLILHEDIGRASFLAIFFASGAVGGFSTLAYHVLRKQWQTYIFGASNCVLGVTGAACTLHSTANIKVLGYEVPVAVWLFLALYSGGEAFYVVKGIKTTQDNVGHLGGIATGIAAGIYLRLKTKANPVDRVRENGESAVASSGREVVLMKEVKVAV